jgi:hypothetical protein
MYIPFGFAGQTGTEPISQNLILWNGISGYNSTSSVWIDQSGLNNIGSVIGNPLTQSLYGWEFDGTTNYIQYPFALTTDMITPISGLYPALTIQIFGTFDTTIDYMWLLNNIYDAPGPGNQGFYEYLSSTEFNMTGRCDAITNWKWTGSYGGPSRTMLTFQCEGACVTGIRNTFYINENKISDKVGFENGWGGSFCEFGWNTHLPTGSIGIPNKFKGVISDIVVYNRYLSQSEVVYNYDTLSSFNTTTL